MFARSACLEFCRSKGAKFRARDLCGSCITRKQGALTKRHVLAITKVVRRFVFCQTRERGATVKSGIRLAFCDYVLDGGPGYRVSFGYSLQAETTNRSRGTRGNRWLAHCRVATTAPTRESKEANRVSSGGHYEKSAAKDKSITMGISFGSLKRRCSGNQGGLTHPRHG